MDIENNSDIEFENDEDSLFVDDYVDDEIILDNADDHYERIEKILNELRMMNYVWTEDEIEKFNEGIARCTIHDPIGIAKYVKTKNAIQVSRRLYLIEEIMLHREPIGQSEIPSAIDCNEELFLKEQESADEALEKEKNKYQKRANIRKDFKYIDGNIFEKRYGRSFLTYYHEFQAITELENSLIEWMKPIIKAIIGFSRQRQPNKKSKSVNVNNEDVFHVLSYFGCNIDELREKYKQFDEQNVSNENKSRDSSESMEVEGSMEL